MRVAIVVSPHAPDPVPPPAVAVASAASSSLVRPSRATTPIQQPSQSLQHIRPVLLINGPHQVASERFQPQSNAPKLPVEAPTTIALANTSTKFLFDSVYSDTNIHDVYAKSVWPLVKGFLDGSDVSVVSYGQTRIGKSYTLGVEADLINESGLIPQSLNDVFESIHSYSAAHAIAAPSFAVTVSVLEIFNESVFDLLDPRNSSSIVNDVVLREGTSQDIELIGASDVLVGNAAEAIRIFSSAHKNRKSPARSHFVYVVKLRQTYRDQAPIISQFRFFDLAGCSRLHENAATNSGVIVNSGLLAFESIVAGADGAYYGQSKLTWMMKDCFFRRENSYSLLIGFVSPFESQIRDTTRTLSICNKATKLDLSLDPNSVDSSVKVELSALKELVNRLKSENSMLRSGVKKDVILAENKALRDELEHKNEEIGKLSALCNFLNNELAVMKTEGTLQVFSGNSYSDSHDVSDCESVASTVTYAESVGESDVTVTGSNKKSRIPVSRPTTPKSISHRVSQSSTTSSIRSGAGSVTVGQNHIPLPTTAREVASPKGSTGDSQSRKIKRLSFELRQMTCVAQDFLGAIDKLEDKLRSLEATVESQRSEIKEHSALLKACENSSAHKIDILTAKLAQVEKAYESAEEYINGLEEEMIRQEGIFEKLEDDLRTANEAELKRVEILNQLESRIQQQCGDHLEQISRLEEEVQQLKADGHLMKSTLPGTSHSGGVLTASIDAEADIKELEGAVERANEAEAKLRYIYGLSVADDEASEIIGESMLETVGETWAADDTVEVIRRKLQDALKSNSKLGDIVHILKARIKVLLQQPKKSHSVRFGPAVSDAACQYESSAVPTKSSGKLQHKLSAALLEKEAALNSLSKSHQKDVDLLKSQLSEFVSSAKSMESKHQQTIDQLRSDNKKLQNELTKKSVLAEDYQNRVYILQAQLYEAQNVGDVSPSDNENVLEVSKLRSDLASATRSLAELRSQQGLEIQPSSPPIIGRNLSMADNATQTDLEASQLDRVIALVKTSSSEVKDLMIKCSQLEAKGESLERELEEAQLKLRSKDDTARIHQRSISLTSAANNTPVDDEKVLLKAEVADLKTRLAGLQELKSKLLDTATRYHTEDEMQAARLEVEDLKQMLRRQERESSDEIVSLKAELARKTAMIVASAESLKTSEASLSSAQETVHALEAKLLGMAVETSNTLGKLQTTQTSLSTLELHIDEVNCHRDILAEKLIEELYLKASELLISQESVLAASEKISELEQTLANEIAAHGVTASDVSARSVEIDIQGARVCALEESLREMQSKLESKHNADLEKETSLDRSDLCGKISELEEILGTKTREFSALLSENHDLSLANESLKAQVSDLASKLNSVEGVLDVEKLSHQSTRTRLDTTCNQIKNEMVALQIELEECRKNLLDSRARHEISNEQISRDAEIRILDIQKKNEALCLTLIQEHQVTVEVLKATSRRVEELESQKRMLEVERTQKADEIQVAELKVALRNAEEKLSTVTTDLELSRELSMNEIAVLNDRLEQVQQQQHRFVSNLINDHEMLMFDLANQKASHHQLEASLITMSDKLQEVNLSYESAISDVLSLNARIGLQKNSIESLERQLNDFRILPQAPTNGPELKKAIHDLEASSATQAMAKEVDLDELQNTPRELPIDDGAGLFPADSVLENGAAREELPSSLRARLEQVQLQEHIFAEALQACHSRVLETVWSSFQDSTAQLLKAEEELAAARNEVETLKIENESMKLKLGALVSQAEFLKSESKNASDLYISSTKSMEFLQNRLNQMESSHAAELGQQLQQRKADQDQINDLSFALTESQRTVEELESSLSSLRQELSEVTNEHYITKDMHSIAQNEVVSLMARLDEIAANAVASTNLEQRLNAVQVHEHNLLESLGKTTEIVVLSLSQTANEFKNSFEKSKEMLSMAESENALLSKQLQEVLLEKENLENPRELPEFGDRISEQLDVSNREVPVKGEENRNIPEAFEPSAVVETRLREVQLQEDAFGTSLEMLHEVVVKALFETISKLENEKATLVDKNKSLCDSINESGTLLHLLRQRALQSEFDLAKVKEEKEALSKLHQSLSSIHNELQSNFGILQDEKRSLGDELETFKGKLKNAEVDLLTLKGLKVELDESRNRLVNSNTKIDVLESELHSLKTLMKTNESVEIRLQQVQQQEQNLLHSTTGAHEAIIRALGQRLDSLEDSHSTILSFNVDLNKKLLTASARTVDCEKELADAVGRSQVAEVQQKGLLEDNSRLLKANGDLTKMIEEYEQKIISRDEQISALNSSFSQEKTDFQTKLKNAEMSLVSQQKAHEFAMSNINTEHSRLKNLYDETKSHVAALNAHIDDAAEQHSSELSKLVHTAKSVTASEVGELKIRLAEVEKHRHHLMSRMELDQIDLLEMSGETSEKVRELELRVQKLHRVNDKILAGIDADHNRTVSAFMDRISSAEKNIALLKLENSSLKEENGVISSAKALAESRVLELEAEIDTLTQKHLAEAAAQASQIGLNAEIQPDEMKSDVANAREIEIPNATTKTKEIEDISAKDAEISDLRNRLESLSGQFENFMTSFLFPVELLLSMSSKKIPNGAIESEKEPTPTQSYSMCPTTSDAIPMSNSESSAEIPMPPSELHQPVESFPMTPFNSDEAIPMYDSESLPLSSPTALPNTIKSVNEPKFPVLANVTSDAGIPPFIPPAIIPPVLSRAVDIVKEPISTTQSDPTTLVLPPSSSPLGGSCVPSLTSSPENPTDLSPTHGLGPMNSNVVIMQPRPQSRPENVMQIFDTVPVPQNPRFTNDPLEPFESYPTTQANSDAIPADIDESLPLAEILAKSKPVNEPKEPVLSGLTAPVGSHKVVTPIPMSPPPVTGLSSQQQNLILPSMGSDVGATQQKTHKMRQKINMLENELSQTQETVNMLTEKLRTGERDAESFRSLWRKLDIEEDLGRKKSIEIARLESRITELLAQLSDSRDQFTAIKEQNLRLSATVGTLQSEVHRLKTASDTKERAIANDYTEQINNDRHVIELLRSDLAEALQNYAILQSEMADLKLLHELKITEVKALRTKSESSETNRDSVGGSDYASSECFYPEFSPDGAPVLSRKVQDSSLTEKQDEWQKLTRELSEKSDRIKDLEEKLELVAAIPDILKKWEETFIEQEEEIELLERELNDAQQECQRTKESCAAEMADRTRELEAVEKCLADAHEQIKAYKDQEQKREEVLVRGDAHSDAPSRATSFDERTHSFSHTETILLHPEFETVVSELEEKNLLIGQLQAKLEKLSMIPEILQSWENAFKAQETDIDQLEAELDAAHDQIRKLQAIAVASKHRGLGEPEENAVFRKYKSLPSFSPSTSQSTHLSTLHDMSEVGFDSVTGEYFVQHDDLSDRQNSGSMDANSFIAMLQERNRQLENLLAESSACITNLQSQISTLELANSDASLRVSRARADLIEVQTAKRLLEARLNRVNVEKGRN
ncbi:hypothetical protein HDU83_004864 [Entophlyctis luteolus]|nr:hypothetical protein HDU83_004864 [Entophlyctis luteolus]